MHLRGRWRIVEMELWDQDAVDFLGPAFIEIGQRNDGSFRFIAVEGWMDIRRVERDGAPAIDFSWDSGHWPQILDQLLAARPPLEETPPA